MIISIATLVSDLSSKQLRLVAKCVMHCESIVSRSHFLSIRIPTGQILT